jgi:hypothetical protein
MFTVSHLSLFLLLLLLPKEEGNMSYKSLSHSKWERKYHVVFIPKGRIEKWTSDNLYTSLLLIIKADKNKYKYTLLGLVLKNNVDQHGNANR